MSERSGDRAAARRYAGALFRAAPPGSLVEVRFRVPSGMGQLFHGASRLDRLVDSIVALSAQTDVYVGVLPRRRRGGGRADVIDRAGVVWADCDSGDSVGALRRFRPSPAMVIASSEEKRHAYWFLAEPVSLDVIELTNRRIALALGADVRCSDPARILRPSGSVNRKRAEPSVVRLVSLAPAARVSFADLDRVLPRAPVSSTTLTRPPRRRTIALSDPLEAIPPRVYVEQLTGQRVGRSGKIRCPFHELSVGEAVNAGVSPAPPLADASVTGRGGLEAIPPPVYFERLTGLRVGPSGKLRCLFHDDRSPSLHVYREPDRGWFCFGCGRGGSVYDLAALLSGRKTRGRDFIELQRELQELLL